MIGDAIYPLSAMLFGPGVYEIVPEMSPVVPAKERADRDRKY